jgi:hypothetical protein
LARHWLKAAAIVLLASALVLALFVHLSRRSDLLDDVVAAPPSGEGAVAPLVAATTTLPLSQTTVHRAGDVALRVSASEGGPVQSSITVSVLGARRKQLATCRYARGSLADTNVMRCPVRDLALVRRVRITVTPRARGLGVVGNDAGVGTLLVPRSHTALGRLRTVLGRIGARHPAPFSGWIVPVGTVLWLSALAGVALCVRRPTEGATADDVGDGEP